MEHRVIHHEAAVDLTQAVEHRVIHRQATTVDLIQAVEYRQTRRGPEVSMK